MYEDRVQATDGSRKNRYHRADEPPAIAPAYAAVGRHLEEASGASRSSAAGSSHRLDRRVPERAPNRPFGEPDESGQGHGEAFMQVCPDVRTAELEVEMLKIAEHRLAIPGAN